MLANSGIDTVNAETFKGISLYLGWLVGILGVLWGILRGRTKIEPTPFPVEKVDKLATRDFVEAQQRENQRRLDGHDSDIRNIYAEMKTNRVDSEQHASLRSATIFKKIEDVRVELSEKIDKSNTLTEKVLRDYERALGRIEGRDKP